MTPCMAHEHSSSRSDSNSGWKNSDTPIRITLRKEKVFFDKKYIKFTLMWAMKPLLKITC